MSTERYGRKRGGKSLGKIGCRLLTAGLAAALGLACQIMGARAQETAGQRLQEAVELQEYGADEAQAKEEVSRKLQEYGADGAQAKEEAGRKLQDALKQQMEAGLQSTEEERYVEAALFAPTMDLEKEEWENFWSLTCAAVSYEGQTYVLTAGDYENFEYGKYARVTGDGEDNTDIVMLPVEGGLAFCYGRYTLNALRPLPLGEMDEDTELKAAFYDVDEDGEYSLISGWLSGSLERTEGGYILDQDIEREEKWNGALVVNAETEEAVGIGVYLDGQYLIREIPEDQFNEMLAVEHWGEVLEGDQIGEEEPKEPETEEPEETETEAPETEEPEETETEEAATEESERAKSVPEEKETGEKPEAAETEEPEEIETEAPAKEEPKGGDDDPDGEAPAEPEEQEEPEDGKIPAQGKWILILTGILVVVFVAGSRKKKGALSASSSEGVSSERSGQNMPPSGTIQLEPEQRQSQYILECLSGPIAGRQIVIYDNFSIGRDPQTSDLALPEGTKGVSRRHCRIELRNGLILLRDLGSSYGTFLENGVKLEAQTPYGIDSGTVFYVGSHQVAFRVTKR